MNMFELKFDGEIYSYEIIFLNKNKNGAFCTVLKMVPEVKKLAPFCASCLPQMQNNVFLQFLKHSGKMT